MTCSGSSNERFLVSWVGFYQHYNANLIKAMDLLLNDDVFGAEKAVEGGNSSYHKVLSQTILFTACIHGNKNNNLSHGGYSSPVVLLHFFVRA